MQLDRINFSFHKRYVLLIGGVVLAILLLVFAWTSHSMNSTSPKRIEIARPWTAINFGKEYDTSFKYWKFIHSQPVQNVIFQNQFSSPLSQKNNSYTAVVYRNTPVKLPYRINKKRDYYKLFGKHTLTRDEFGETFAKDSTLSIPFNRGKYDIIIKEDLFYTTKEIIIWDAEARLLYYTVSAIKK
ncbi:hypothetical protein [Flammeovirga kamogawensis]|uniref:Uncharacterized protein n=1 Tax=Flammeovirga kamogawensis TaxID=373891 RepID=A0ABX8H175_9BACT|nr:hypothetical protein [Flammeovirga kamogawensis]MBB6462225.1 hypothetical protein [Flammeovirga kamogawensis]QWG09374.1 hypothetical protein KM029_22470 [Flammeovirga kamogawensis]TRX64893.1 hypothetical protein EO216_20380 [Flammeovirga kamogawensis]